MRGSPAALLLLAACGTRSGPVERVPIPPRSSVRAAADSLKAHHLIGTTAWFRIRARLAGVDRTVKTGIYEFPRGTSIGNILHAFKAGSSLRFRVTLPPGGTVYDLARSAGSVLSMPRDGMLSAATDTSLMHEFGLQGPGVEGWLLPQSFDFGGF